MKSTSVEEVGRGGKRRDGKVSVLICFFHGQIVGEREGTRDDSASATGFVKEERGFSKTHANV
jgi:hypothetical protein